MNNKNKRLFLFGMLFAVFLSFSFATQTLASVGDIQGNLKKIEKEVSFTGKDTSVYSFVANVIKFIFAISGTIMLIISVYAGFSWLTSGGDPEKIGKAKKWLINSAIGLSIMLLSYSLTDFVLANLKNILGG